MDIGVAAIPVVGGPVSELADIVMAPSLAKRRDLWLEKLGELLNELIERVEGFEVRRLADDEVFVSAVAEASRIAVGTHLEEKLNVLKICLINLALDEDRDDFMAMQLLRLVGVLDPEHLIVLSYLDNPGAWFDAKKINRPTYLTAARSKLLESAGLPVVGGSLEIVLRTLRDNGLANTDQLNGMVRGESMWTSLATDLGRQLLAFVKVI